MKGTLYQQIRETLGFGYFHEYDSPIETETNLKNIENVLDEAKADFPIKVKDYVNSGDDEDNFNEVMKWAKKWFGILDDKVEQK